MINHSATIVRSLRKFHQIGQVELAKEIGFSQSKLSKVEHGALELTASEWVYLCSRFMIDPYCITTGKIELMGTDAVDFSSIDIGKCFKIPKRYLGHSGSTIRSLYPLLQFFYKNASPQVVDAFFKRLKIDQDYFIFMGNPINLVFAQELVRYMMDEKILTPENFNQLVSAENFKKIHSISFTEGVGNFFDKELGKLLGQINKYYEINTNYTQCNSNKEILSARDNLHVMGLKLSPEFNKFRMMHNLLHIQTLAKLTGDKRVIQANPVKDGWIITAV